jgi:hypothetical protein
MRKNKLILLLIIAVVFTACGPEKVYVSGVVLDTTDLHISRIGYGRQLTVAIQPENADDQNIVWRSSNPAIATVDEYGWVTAVAQGTATIEVVTMCGAKTAQCVVTVTQLVEGIALNKNSITLLIGRDETLTATISPTDATGKNVTWSSSNTSIARVDANGTVTAVSRGTVTITAKTENEKTAECTVTTATVAEVTDTGVVIGGVRWATRNVDRPGTFAQRPEDAGMLYRQGSRVAWSSEGTNVSNWSIHYTTDPNWDPCPSGWRLPTRNEIDTLRENSDWADLNGTRALRVGVAPNQIFLPVVGSRNRQDGSRGGVGAWVELQYSNDGCIRRSYSGSFSVFPASSSNANSVRCVAG